MDEDVLNEKLTLVREQLKRLVSEAQELRAGAELPAVQSLPTEQVEALHDVRQRLDRVEELYIIAVRLRGVVSTLHNELSNEHDDQWDSLVAKAKNATVSRGSEYTGPRERYAEANMQTIETKRKVRLASETLDLCSMMVDVLKTIKFGLEGVRGDVLAMIRVWQIESGLER